MAILIPRKERVSGVCYAQTSQGVELPIVDVTHPSFALDASPAAMAALRGRAGCGGCCIRCWRGSRCCCRGCARATGRS